jgi:hypothetical protein
LTSRWDTYKPILLSTEQEDRYRYRENFSPVDPRRLSVPFPFFEEGKVIDILLSFHGRPTEVVFDSEDGLIEFRSVEVASTIIISTV